MGRAGIEPATTSLKDSAGGNLRTPERTISAVSGTFSPSHVLSSFLKYAQVGSNLVAQMEKSQRVNLAPARCSIMESPHGAELVRIRVRYVLAPAASVGLRPSEKNPRTRRGEFIA